MTRSEILKKAEDCVCGQRETDYGTPEDNFANIAILWTAYLETDISSVDVAMMMSLLKIARIKAGGTNDSFVDLAGYAACGGEIFGGTKRGINEQKDQIEIDPKKQNSCDFGKGCKKYSIDAKGNLTEAVIK